MMGVINETMEISWACLGCIKKCKKSKDDLEKYPEIMSFCSDWEGSIEDLKLTIKKIDCLIKEAKNA